MQEAVTTNITYEDAVAFFTQMNSEMIAYSRGKIDKKVVSRYKPELIDPYREALLRWEKSRFDPIHRKIITALTYKMPRNYAMIVSAAYRECGVGIQRIIGSKRIPPLTFDEYTKTLAPIIETYEDVMQIECFENAFASKNCGMLSQLRLHKLGKHFTPASTFFAGLPSKDQTLISNREDPITGEYRPSVRLGRDALIAEWEQTKREYADCHIIQYKLRDLPCVDRRKSYETVIVIGRAENAQSVQHD
jgi:hypothetical protein